mmetsp:Transcript_28619/g.63896  ORF Transcript_28619/g.63896 Transcript_28619/m.63896 type:complete len:152 (-) Transcript_28619:247-702(-)|eukprot:CAMPEP_0172614804 /NCGR_PEP_ID=MMETSP1068-20121228/55488_1 /TAXON_ID=35684 /ORGANISM="Pseudopedinella elastica, Strain CCMP716" /LENGTH=151 /DNA_ID=CAMNT_0013419731 /DNA_START=46 /DNA_END=501 /DNA_ORIENTATION=+
MNKSDSCVERVCGALGAGGMFGSFVGAAVAQFKMPSVLERAAQVGTAAAQAQIPVVSRYVGGNAALFAGVGAAYAGGKCIAEGLVGDDHPVCAGIGGMMSGAVLGVYMQSPWVMLGATSGLFLVGFAADVNGAKIMQDPERMKEKYFGLRK